MIYSCFIISSSSGESRPLLSLLLVMPDPAPVSTQQALMSPWPPSDFVLPGQPAAESQEHHGGCIRATPEWKGVYN